MYKPTEKELKELGFQKQNEYWWSLTILNLDDYPSTLYYGNDGKSIKFVLIVRDAGNNECEHHIYPSSRQDIETIIRMLTPDSQPATCSHCGGECEIETVKYCKDINCIGHQRGG